MLSWKRLGNWALQWLSAPLDTRVSFRVYCIHKTTSTYNNLLIAPWHQWEERAQPPLSTRFLWVPKNYKTLDQSSRPMVGSSSKDPLGERWEGNELRHFDIPKVLTWIPLTKKPSWGLGQCISKKDKIPKYEVNPAWVSQHIQYMQYHVVIGKFMGIRPWEKTLVWWINT